MSDYRAPTDRSIKTYYSSRTEALLGMLLARLKDDNHPDPFLVTPIIVPNSGMQRYLQLSIAETLGICSHYHILHAAEFLNDCYQKLLGEDPYQPVIAVPDSRQLALRLCHYWQVNPPVNEALAALLSHYPAAKQRYILAKRLARLFIHYLQERPQLIENWQQGRLQTQHPHESWQYELFTALALTDFSPSQRQQAFHQALTEKKSAALIRSPIYLFGFHALPPGQLSDFTALASVTDVYAYIFNPSPNYWLSLVPPSVKLKNTLTQTAEAKLMQIGNPLLANWGQAGKYLLEQLNANYELNTDEYSQTPITNLLTWLQAAIRQAEDKSADELFAAAELSAAAAINPGGIIAHEIAGQDLSLSVHIAASARREVEILYDNLCRLFARHADLSPAQVFVMVPNLRDYAPHITAVFGHGGDEQTAIPFSLANQSIAESDNDIKALLALLTVIDEDFAATALFDALSEPSISRQLGLDEEQLATIHRWFSDSRFAARFHDNSNGQFSSLAKLTDMLLLAAVGGEHCHVGHRAALPAYHATQYDCVAVFCYIISLLRPFATLKERQQPLDVWVSTLHEFSDTFLGANNSLSARITTWSKAFNHQQLATADFDYDSVITDLTDFLQNEELHGPFLSGGVSFCAMVPMRAIPAKVICLLGMNQDFPPLTVTDPLDLRQVQPLWSDKNHHKEYAYCFLETIMAARQKLMLSYIGQDEKSGDDLPPSVLIEELISFINRHFPDYIAAAKQYYPLQGFLPDPQSRPTYQTFYTDRLQLPLSVDDNQAPDEQQTDDGRLTPELPEQWHAKAFADALYEPLLFYLTQHVGATPISTLEKHLREHDTLAPDGGLDYWAYRQAWLSQVLFASDAVYELQQQNRYAPHPVSQAVLHKLANEMQPLINALQAFASAENYPLKRFISAQPESKRHYLLFTTNRYTTVSGAWDYATSPLDAKKLLRAWVNHILLNHLDLPNRHSHLFTLEKQGKVKHTHFLPLDNNTAVNVLTELWQLLQMFFTVPTPVILHLNRGKLIYKPHTYRHYPRLQALFEKHNTRTAYLSTLDSRLQTLNDNIHTFLEQSS